MGLNVIGLVSGGKDSFFSLLHCQAQGHRIVALANVYPATTGPEEDESDVDSFMYQTVGHQVIPLYAAATGLPVYRQPLVGRAVQEGREYAAGPDTLGSSDMDETESMTLVLRQVLAQHPEANAVSAGALLSTYQRTRVESVAVRLGLTSLAYLWQLPVLSALSALSAQSVPPDYLLDLAAAGLDARIVKVASGGLDESLLWTNVASAAGRMRLQRALQRFGLLDHSAEGTAMLLGEGGEYETLVVAGPSTLFAGGAVAVAEADRRVVQAGGGSAWLQVRRASVEATVSAGEPQVRVPGLLDARFVDVLRKKAEVETSAPALCAVPTQDSRLSTWCVVPSSSSSSITAATQSVVDQVRARLQTATALAPTRCIVRTTVLLRRMGDFGAVNAVYGTLFPGSEANPPARVAVACGDELPLGVDVVAHVTVLIPDEDNNVVDRQGLHVQSRSYWAPANIGPYSQAISVPIVRLVGGAAGDPPEAATALSGPRLVCVAGQIPLVPATMALPDAAVEAQAASDELRALSGGGSADGGQTGSAGGADGVGSAGCASFGFQATLALQHLWRIGLAVQVQWWSSAVAYVPRQSGVEPGGLAGLAVRAAQLWQAAHQWRPAAQDEDGDDDDDDSGPDLWDRTFDSRYYAPASSGRGGTDGEAALQLPDGRVLDASAATAVPPMFLAEVEELPRHAPVEWHAHAGFSHVAPGSVRVTCRAAAVAGQRQPLEYRTASSGLVHVVRLWPRGSWTAEDAAVLREPADAVYVDWSLCNASVTTAATSTPVVPCASLWSSRGEQLAAVVVQTRAE